MDNPFAAPQTERLVRRRRSRRWHRAGRIAMLIFYAMGILLLAYLQWTG